VEVGVWAGECLRALACLARSNKASVSWRSTLSFTGAAAALLIYEYRHVTHWQQTTNKRNDNESKRALVILSEMTASTPERFCRSTISGTLLLTENVIKKKKKKGKGNFKRRKRYLSEPKGKRRSPGK